MISLASSTPGLSGMVEKLTKLGHVPDTKHPYHTASETCVPHPVIAERFIKEPDDVDREVKERIEMIG